MDTLLWIKLLFFKGSNHKSRKPQLIRKELQSEWKNQQQSDPTDWRNKNLPKMDN